MTLTKLIPSKFHILLVVSVIAVGLLLTYIYKQHNTIQTNENIILALTDTVTLYKTKDGKNAAYIRVLKGSKADILAIAKKKDPIAYKILKETKGIQSLTNLSTSTKTDTTVKIDSLLVGVKINSKDKQRGDTLISVKPDSLYISKQIKDQWYTADIKVVNDSLNLKLDVKNEFKIVTKEKSNGFLKGKSLVVDVTNLNPYTTTTGLSSFVIDPPKTKLLPKIVIVAATVATIILLK